MGKNILMISGEASGDLHGSSLIRALKRLAPSVSIKGMGGEKMMGEGLTGIDSTRLSVVGIVEVFSKFAGIIKAFSRLKRLLNDEKFDCVVLIDYPDFNLRFAAEAKKKGVPVVYYISPQVWAWRKKRIYRIARLVDRMLVVFPFEEPIYREAGVQVEYIGHPLTTEAVCAVTKEEARQELGVAPDKTTVAILPGSRTEEIKRHIRPMLDAVALVSERLGGGKSVEALLPASSGIEDGFLGELLKGSRVTVKVVRKKTYTALRASDAAVVSSGTATLETALIGTPMVIAYILSPISYFLARMLVGVKFIGLPNIVAGRSVVPELIQKDATAENIARELLDILKNPSRRKAILQGYEEIKRGLSAGAPPDSTNGPDGGSAPERAARAVYRLIEAKGVAAD
ncbi:MAG: lipid-A-disaccharide synthase [Deltaproteobacteria bacterium]|nr:lipid-A-disaccharide synthase [Deltaproteobacteria bacterium]